jgi:hypothetical protein
VQDGKELQVELPVVMSASTAKALAQQMLGRAWAGREKLRLNLPPSRMGLKPGTQVEVPFSPSRWRADKVSIDSFVTAVELTPVINAGVDVAADGGRAATNPDLIAGEVVTALLDVPALYPNSVTLLLAASSEAAAWKRTTVEVTAGGQSFAVRTAARKTILGNAATVLASAEPSPMDVANSVDVQLIDPDQWLVSCDDAALAAGANLALIGDELVQFGEATPLGAGRFKLSRLLRGRGGTEASISDHASGEIFCLIETGSLRPIVLPVTSIGKEVTAEVSGGEKVSLVVRPRGSAIATPSGGTNVDAEARSSIDQILATLRQNGLIAT